MSAPAALRRCTMPLLIFLVSFAVQAASLPRVIFNIYDEGLIVFGAQRVLEGDIPYRDFWSLYAPGQFYAVAGLFSLFGSSVLVERLWDVAVRAAVVAFGFMWARRLKARAYAYAASVTILLILAGAGFHGFPIIHALLFGLISGYLVLAGSGAAQPTAYFVAAGALAGVAALFRHDIGFYVFAAEALALACRPIIAQSGHSLNKPARKLLALGGGAVVVVAPVAIWLLMNVPAHDLWFSLFDYVMTTYPAVRGMPFPDPPNPRSLLSGTQSAADFNESALIYFPLAAAAMGIVHVLRAARKQPESSEQSLQSFGVLLLSLMSMFLYLKGMVRVSSLHLLQSIVPAVLLVFVLAGRGSRATSRLRYAVPFVAVAVVFGLAASHARSAYVAARENWSALRPFMPEAPRGLRGALAQVCTPQAGLERARCFQVRPDDAAVIQFLQQQSSPNEVIYIGTSVHDRIFINNIMLYFLAERPSATKWHQFDPGVQTTTTVQSEIVDELTRHKVRYLVLSSEWAENREPNASALSSGVTLLDDYIRSNFVKAQEFGHASIWERQPRSGDR
jgi:hypothetical protein